VSRTPARTVVIIGASSGIGRATALRLAGEGANVVLVSRSRQSLAETEQECVAAGGAALAVTADVCDAAAVDTAFASALKTFGTVDAIVHSAAALAYGRFEDVPAAVFDKALDVTLRGTANVARSALAVFDRQGRRGSLVVVGSLLGKISTPYMCSYVTPKWAVHGLVRTLQIEARSTPGIAISLVSPGGVNTPVYRQAGTYLGRHGRPPPPVDSPERVARSIVRAIDRPRRERSVGPANPLVLFGFRLLPGLFDRLVTPLMRLGGLSRDSAPVSPGNVLSPQPQGEAVHGRWGRHWMRPAAAVAAAMGTVAARRLAAEIHTENGNRTAKR
jgi:NAD(P)-dependent dehydrogenase (short-subunit alcohol dehydrogenase family)